MALNAATAGHEMQWLVWQAWTSSVDVPHPGLA